jgi:hypothetical protein
MTTTPHPAPAEYRECRLVEGAPCYFCEARDGKVPVYKLVKMHGSAEAWRCPDCKSVYIMSPAPAEKLTAEQEALLRRHAMLMDSTYPLGDGKGFLEASMDDVSQSVPSLPNTAPTAIRAETEAVRRERDEAVASATAWHKAYCDTARSLDALRSLAAELVEGLDLWNAYGCQICHGDCASANPPVDGCPVKLTYELKRRARAQGIGGERETGNA